MSDKEIIIQALTDLVNSYPERQQEINAMIALFGDHWNSINIQKQLNKMATEQNEQLKPLFSALEDIIMAELPILIEKGESAIVGLFHKHIETIQSAIEPLTICPQGYHKDANGVCVPDVGP